MKKLSVEQQGEASHENEWVAATGQRIKLLPEIIKEFGITWELLNTRYQSAPQAVKDSHFEPVKDTFAEIIYRKGKGVAWKSFEKYASLLAQLFVRFGAKRFEEIADNVKAIPSADRKEPVNRQTDLGSGHDEDGGEPNPPSLDSQSRVVEKNADLVAELFDYLRSVSVSFSQFPWNRPNQSGSFFESIHIQVRLAPRRSQTLANRIETSVSTPGGEYEEAENRTYSNRADPKQFVHEEGRAPQRWSSAPNGLSARSKYPWAVILADPGMEKTTLLRYEGWNTVRESLKLLQENRQILEQCLVPIYIRQADLAAINDEKDVVESILAFALNAKGLDQFTISPELVAFLRQQIITGHIVVLLDAQDEVAQEDYKQLIKLTRGIIALNPTRLYLTSRRAGYRGNIFEQMARSGPELEIVAFSSEDIRLFVKAFFGKERLPNGRLIAHGVYESLSRNSALRGLAQTPLLLTMLCVTVWERSQDGRQVLPLPSRRSELYSEFMCGLLGGWSMYRDGEIANPSLVMGLVNATVGPRLQFAARVAWELGGKSFERTHFSWDEVKRTVKRCMSLARAARCSTADDAIDMLWRRTGVLTEEGKDLVFLHLTFQEHLVGKYLSDIVNDRGWNAEVYLIEGRKRVRILVSDLLKKVAWLPRWQESIVLMAGELNDPVPLLDMLTDAGMDDYFRHRLAIAARCLSELSDFNHPAGRHSSELFERCEAIVDETFQLCWERRLKSEELLAAHLETCLASLATSQVVRGQVDGQVCRLLAAAEASGTTEQQVAFVLLEQLISTGVSGIAKQLQRFIEGSDLFAKANAARLLGKLDGKITGRCEQALLSCLFEKDQVVREAAATGLAQLGDRVSNAISRELLTLLSHADHGVGRAAATALAGSVQNLPEPDRRKLADLMQDDLDGVRASAIHVASGLQDSVTNEELRLILLSLEDSSAQVVNSAAFALGKLQWQLGYDEFHHVLQLLSHTTGLARYAAARALGNMSDRHSVEIVDLLISKLADPDAGVREASARALRLSSWTVRERHIDELSCRLETSNTGEQRAVALALAFFANRLRSIDIERLISCLHSSDDGTRTAAVRALSAIRERLSNAHLSVLRGCLNNVDERVRVATTEVLGPLQILQSSEYVAELPSLIQRTDREKLGMRYAAIQATAELGERADRRHLSALMNCLHSTTDFTSRVWAIIAIRRWHSLGIRAVSRDGGLVPSSVYELSSVDDCLLE